MTAHLHLTAIPTTLKGLCLFQMVTACIRIKGKPGPPGLPDKQLPLGEAKQQHMENFLMAEGASDACPNRKGQGKNTKQDFKQA